MILCFIVFVTISSLQVKVGIIGGTGLEDPQILENARLIENVDTPYGKISDKMLEGEYFKRATSVLMMRDRSLVEVQSTVLNVLFSLDMDVLTISILPMLIIVPIYGHLLIKVSTVIDRERESTV